MNRTWNGLTCAAFAALLLAGCSDSDEGPPGPAFSQADLAGDWDVLQFSTNSLPGWMHAVVTIDGTGKVTVSSVLDDTGGGELPPPGFDLRATLASDGTVRLGGADGSPLFHGSMTRAKTVVFGTDEEGSPALRRNLHAWRKRTPGVTYSSADLAGWTFAFHGVYAGSAPSWMYGFGTTDAGGVLTLTEVHDSAGGSGSPGAVATLAIDAAGVVVNVGGMLRGVMTPDKHAILCVDVAGDAADPLPGFLVVQRTGETFGLADLAGERVAHGIISGADATSSGWLHGVNAFDTGGLQTFSEFANSTGSTALPAPRQYALSPGGVLTTAADPTFHGQLAHDAAYSVRTGTVAAGPILVVNAR